MSSFSARAYKHIMEAEFVNTLQAKLTDLSARSHDLRRYL